MILSALNDYYQRLLGDEGSGISPPGYSQEKIGFAIVLASDGGVLDVVDMRSLSGHVLVPRMVIVPASRKRPGTGSKSFFLWDKTSYALGVGVKSDRTVQDHKAFKALHRALLADCDDPGLAALLAFLRSWAPEDFRKNVHFAGRAEEMLDANIAFCFECPQLFLHDRPAARAIWTRHLSDADRRAMGMCLVTGEQAPVARLHPAIKGVAGAQSSGASIVSFNLEASASYGKTQGENAPVSEQAAFAYTTALNHLLRRDAVNRQRLQIGDSSVVFWAQAADKGAMEEAERLLATFFNPRGDDDQASRHLHDVLDWARQKRPLRDLKANLDDDTRIFVLGLAPNASRLSIRFWETDTLAGFTGRLASYFDDLELKPAPWRRPPSPQTLALATVPIQDRNSTRADPMPALGGELARAVITGARYPQSVLGTVAMRMRTDGRVSGTRVALCKGVLTRAARLDKHQGKHNAKEEPPMSLDPSCTDTGYLLGRLFSSLENVQRAALGRRINATIRDRYYGVASATPASIYPVLLRNVQSDLGKLRKEQGGLAATLEKSIGQIVDALPTTFPRSLPIEEQGRFAIGYYHQTQARYVSADEGLDDLERGFE